MDGRYCRSRVALQKIILSESQKKILSEHADHEKPNESCAVLFGNRINEDIDVKEVFLTKNIEASPINFTISNDALIECYKLAEIKEMEIVGIFHSHPGSIAYPSNTDRKFMHINPVVWVIYSGISKEFKAFILDADVIEIQIEFL